MQTKVECPYCGYVMPLIILPEAECKGIKAKCKNRNCKKEFEVRVEKGIQSR